MVPAKMQTNGQPDADDPRDDNERELDHTHERVQRVEESILYTQHEHEQLMQYVKALESAVRTLERRMAMLESLALRESSGESASQAGDASQP